VALRVQRAQMLRRTSAAIENEQVMGGQVQAVSQEVIDGRSRAKKKNASLDRRLSFFEAPSSDNRANAKGVRNVRLALRACIEFAERVISNRRQYSPTPHRDAVLDFFQHNLILASTSFMPTQ
jgi:hypothetical protein